MKQLHKYYLFGLGITLFALAGLQAYYLNTSFQLEKKEFISQAHKIGQTLVSELEKLESDVREDSIINSFKTLSHQAEFQRAHWEILLNEFSINRNNSKKIIDSLIHIHTKDNGFKLGFKNIFTSVYDEVNKKEMIPNDSIILYTSSLEVRHPYTVNHGKWKSNQSSNEIDSDLGIHNSEQYIYTIQSEASVDLLNINELIFKKMFPLIAVSFLLTGLLLYLFVQSIRNLKRQEEKIRALHLNIDSIAHELNTPLTTLKFAIKNNAFLNEDNLIGRQLQRIEQTIAQIHYNNEQNAQMLKKEDVFSTIQRLKERFPSIQIQEYIDFQKNNLLSLKDFEQIADNLTENAFKYGSSQLQIQCVFRETIRLEWEDNGIGIPEKERDKIFEKYYRIDRAINQSVNGLGVGLYIIHQIIHRYQGTIEVAQGRSNGTLFTIFISDK